jgi:hypothetical protein
MFEKEKNTSLNDTLEKATNKDNAEEIGGFNGPEPTTYGDWQHNGRVSDF